MTFDFFFPQTISYLICTNAYGSGLNTGSLVRVYFQLNGASLFCELQQNAHLFLSIQRPGYHAARNLAVELDCTLSVALFSKAVMSLTYP